MRRNLNDVPDDSAAGVLGRGISCLRAALGERRYISVRGRIGPAYYARLRRDLPYVLERTDLPDLPDVRILVNRDYKPLGTVMDGWAHYEDYPNMWVRLTPEEVARVCAPLPQALFDDGNPPWMGRREGREYLQRLELLREILLTRELCAYPAVASATAHPPSP